MESVDREGNDAGVSGVYQEHEKEGSSLRPTVSTTTTGTAVTVAAAASDNHLDH